MLNVMFFKLDLKLNDIDIKLGIVMIFYELNYDRKYYFVEWKLVSKDIFININFINKDIVGCYRVIRRKKLGC